MDKSHIDGVLGLRLTQQYFVLYEMKGDYGMRELKGMFSVQPPGESKKPHQYPVLSRVPGTTRAPHAYPVNTYSSSSSILKPGSPCGVPLKGITQSLILCTFLQLRQNDSIRLRVAPLHDKSRIQHRYPQLLEHHT